MTNWKKFEFTSAEDLINLFQDEATDQLQQDEAFLALLFRFRKDLLQKTEIICAKRGYDTDVAREITENTFKIYAKSKGFDKFKANQSTIEGSFLTYLYRIAGNELNDHYHREQKKKKGLLYTGDEKIVTVLPVIDVIKLDPESRIIHRILESMSYSHQVIYLTYKTHERDGVNLPKKLLIKLRAHLGDISQTTVRGYKKEVTDRIENARSIIQDLKLER